MSKYLRFVVFLVCAASLHATVARAQFSLGNGCNSDPTSDVGDPRYHGRVFDYRIADISQGNYICRWYLERRDPTAASSDVVNPITYVIDADVPKEWHPYILKGIQEWEPIFDSLGFRHALAMRVASATDTISPPKNVIRVHKKVDSILMMTTDCSAFANTGQLSYCDISINDGFFDGPVARDACVFNRGAHLEIPLPCPDSLLKRYAQVGFAHEVGHSLGLHHNFSAGTVYPTDSLRSATFVHRWGHTPSIMSYALYNFVAQPEDHIPLQDKWMRVGPYDRFAIAWMYGSIPEAKTSEDELPTLERWRRVQDTAAYLRVDGVNNWLGGDDQVKAIEYQTRGLLIIWRRVLAMDTAAALSKMKEGGRADVPASWKKLYETALQTMIGGRLLQSPYPRDQDSTQFTPISAELQLRVFRFTLEHALYGQDSLLQLMDLVAGQAKQRRTTATDSVPFVIDISPESRFPLAERWQEMQRTVLENLATSVANLPSSAVPTACQYLADGLRALAKFEASASPALKASAAILHTSLASSEKCPKP